MMVMFALLVKGWEVFKISKSELYFAINMCIVLLGKFVVCMIPENTIEGHSLTSDC